MLRVVICYLLLLSPACARVELPMPDPSQLKASLQRAVGRDWIVATTPGGYVVTSFKSIVLLPDISSSSKLNLNQRILHSQPRHLVVRVLFTPPGTMHQFVSRHPGDNELPIVEREKASGYFPCYQSGDENSYYWCPIIDGPRYAVFLFANVSPYESIHDQDQSDDYNGAILGLGRVFGFDPFANVIED